MGGRPASAWYSRPDSVNIGPHALIEHQPRGWPAWRTPAGRIIMRANQGTPTGAGRQFARSPADIDEIGLRRAGPIRNDTFRAGPIRNDTFRAGCGDEPRPVWHYEREPEGTHP